MLDEPLGVMPAPPDPALVNALRRPAKYVQSQFSLDTPEQDLLSPETAADVALGFTPLGIPMALRDVARGAVAKDPVAMSTAAAGILPWNKLGNAVAKSELIAGKKALQAPLSDLELAKAGGDFKSTGWYQGQEETKPWKWEIDDSAAKIHPTNRSGELGSILDHPELYKNYPSLAKMKVLGTMDATDKEWGQFLPNSRGGSIALNTHTDDEFLSTLLHEVQHGIQAKERGFSKGTNRNAIADGLKEMRDFFGTTPSTSDAVFADKHYLNNMGEVEARTTQMRQKYTPEQRRQINPLDQNIPLTDRVDLPDSVEGVLARSSNGQLTPEDQAILPHIVKLIRTYLK